MVQQNMIHPHSNHTGGFRFQLPPEEVVQWWLSLISSYLIFDCKNWTKHQHININVLYKGYLHVRIVVVH